MCDFTMKDTLISYYSFRERNDGILTYKLESGDILKFRLFEKQKTADLLIDELKEDGYKEKSLILSFTFDNYNHKECLDKLIQDTM